MIYQRKKHNKLQEILSQLRNQLETEIEDIFFSAIGENTTAKRARTVKDQEPSSLQLYKIYALFRLFTSKKRPTLPKSYKRRIRRFETYRRREKN